MFPSKKNKTKGRYSDLYPKYQVLNIKWFSLCHIHIMTSLKNLIFILFYILHDLQVPFFLLTLLTLLIFGGQNSLIPHVKAIPVFFFFERQRKEFYFII